jgi:hypothetical protein
MKKNPKRPPMFLVSKTKQKFNLILNLKKKLKIRRKTSISLPIFIEIT